jgi:urea transport system permease protein
LQSSLGATAGPALSKAIVDALTATSTYQARLDRRRKAMEELPNNAAAIKRQLKTATSRFQPALKEAAASFDLVMGDRPTQLAAVTQLGDAGTGDAASLLGRALEASRHNGDAQLEAACQKALVSAQHYQTEIHIIQNTFAGLSLGSILVLLALGLSIIFGLMGVINMAHGEFMMVGAFTTYVVSEAFKHLPPGLYDYYLIAAVPAAFLVSGAIGLIVEWAIIRHLYGRPLETLLATWGVGLVLVQAVRLHFGDSLSVKPPGWMEGGWEVMPDLVLARNRIFIIAYCAVCIAAVYFIVNRTKLGLLLRATTQNRQMASALGVPTRRVDALTFAFGAGLAGLAGVAVPLYNKINPGMGSEYIVESFMVVVVGGVGTLAGAIWAGLGLGFLGKYLEALLASSAAFESGSSVMGKVLVMLAVVLFLQWRPQGMFPPKGRLADA